MKLPAICLRSLVAIATNMIWLERDGWAFVGRPEWGLENQLLHRC